MPKPFEKKREKNGRGQPQLPSVREPAASSLTQVLPMQLKAGDRLVDETGEWEVISRPYTAADGKIAHAPVRRVDQPAVTELRTWGALERISVQRTSAEEGQAMTPMQDPSIDPQKVAAVGEFLKDAFPAKTSTTPRTSTGIVSSIGSMKAEPAASYTACV